MRSILLVNVAPLHSAVHRFGCSTATLAKCSLCCKVLKPTFAYVLQTGAYNRLLRGKCGTWTTILKAKWGKYGNCKPRAGCRSKQLASALFFPYTSDKRAADMLLPHFWFVRQKRMNTSSIVLLNFRGPGHTCPMVTPKLGPRLPSTTRDTAPSFTREKTAAVLTGPVYEHTEEACHECG